ncbi:hypothetical protein DFH06DRAFT_1371734 [Mycena polygramma]|nr:hypothetical protein DFH06DRAFT_1371734 [Mycena polygramma]
MAHPAPGAESHPSRLDRASLPFPVPRSPVLAPRAIANDRLPFMKVFSVPTSKYIKYKNTVWLPWFIKRYAFRRDIPRPPPIIARLTFVDTDHSDGSGNGVDEKGMRWLLSAYGFQRAWRGVCQ